VSALVVLAVLVLIAVLAPRLGADTRWDGAGVHPDRPVRTHRRPRQAAVAAPRTARRTAPALRDV